MSASLLSEPLAGLLALLVLALCWPLSQALRHEKMRPLAGYLLFVSLFGLVSALSFRVLLWLAVLLLPPAALEGMAAPVILALLSMVPGLIAARWIVRRPQQRRMPK
ncbi:hypothetical protein [Marinobacterium aestuariivivens]|uniref:Uncharacterized protein n=1 Tax=Marinobacterium aestuariivivens TaxID=1698799 RepID=A0ABW2A242_9GAMM